MVLRRERLKKRLLQNQLKLIELKGKERLASAGGSGEMVVEGDSGEEEEEVEEELESLEGDGPCSPPPVRQTR